LSLRQNRAWVQGGLLLIMALLFSALFIGPPLFFLQHRRHPTLEQTLWGAIIRWGAAGTAGLALALVIGLALVVQQVGSQNRFVLGVGVPSVAASWFIVPQLLTWLTGALIVLMALVWRNRLWTLGWRWYYSTVALACAGFVLLTRYWGLL
jgi:hypothetical protein